MSNNPHGRTASTSDARKRLAEQEAAARKVDHGPFCPAFTAPTIGRFHAVEATGPCTCQPAAASA